MNSVDLSILPEYKQEQIVYLVKLMNRYPDLNITQIISAATKYAGQPNVPFNFKNITRCLKLYSEKDKYTANRFIIEGASNDGNTSSTPDSYI